MERVEHRIKLNLMKAGLQGQVIVKKADSDSRKINIYLSSAAGPFNMSDIASAILRAEKPDGKVMFNSCTVCEDRLEYIITTQTIAATGTVTCEITLMSSTGQVLVTPQFEIIVADIIYSDTEIESTNEYTALEEAIKKATALKDGTTFTPNVSDEGVLSWTNADGKDNPAAVNIKGPKGDSGAKGDKGDPGKNGADGSPGAAGADGVTPHIGDNGNWFIGSTDTGKPSRGASTAEDISYTLPEDVQTTFPDIVELESDTVKSGLDVAMYYALAGMFAKYISCNLQSGSGETVSVDLQRILDGFVFPAMFKAHEHDNKSVLDKFAESDGKPTYDGTAIGDGGSTETELFVVNVQAQSEEGEYTITSHDKTYTQIDEAYKAGKQVLVVCTITGEDSTFLLPLIWATETDYEFSIFVGAVMSIFVDTTDKWTISQDYLEASSIMAKISDDALAESSSLQSILNYKVYPAVEKAHEHSNESVLDGFSDSNGVLKYNNQSISVQKITTGTNITLVDNTEYRLADITTLTLNYPSGDFECWLKLTFAESGSITVTLPTGTKYIGNAPSFANGETWEMSIKDGVVIAQKVGEGT